MELEQAQTQSQPRQVTDTDSHDYKRGDRPLDSELARQAAAGTADVPDDAGVVFDLDDVTVRYGSFPAIRNVTLQIRERMITAMIGPSGCGKTTLLRCLDRMNDLIPTASV